MCSVDYRQEQPNSSKNYCVICGQTIQSLIPAQAQKMLRHKRSSVWIQLEQSLLPSLPQVLGKIKAEEGCMIFMNYPRLNRSLALWSKVSCSITKCPLVYAIYDKGWSL